MWYIAGFNRQFVILSHMWFNFQSHIRFIVADDNPVGIRSQAIIADHAAVDFLSSMVIRTS